jgi:hypothetical protein
MATSSVSRPDFMEPSAGPPIHRTPYECPTEIDYSTMSKLDRFNTLLEFWGMIPNIRKGVFSFTHYCEWETSQTDVKDTFEMMTNYIILNRDWWGAMCTPSELPNIKRMWLLEEFLPSMSVLHIRMLALPLYLQWSDLNPTSEGRRKKMEMFVEAYKHILSVL